MCWGRGTWLGNLGWSGGISHESGPLDGDSVFGTLGLCPTLSTLRHRQGLMRMARSVPGRGAKPAQVPGSSVSGGAPWAFSSRHPLWHLRSGSPRTSPLPHPRAAPSSLHSLRSPDVRPSWGHPCPEPTTQGLHGRQEWQLRHWVSVLFL